MKRIIVEFSGGAVIEKSFGRDLASALELDRGVLAHPPPILKPDAPQRGFVTFAERSGFLTVQQFLAARSP